METAHFEPDRCRPETGFQQQTCAQWLAQGLALAPASTRGTQLNPDWLRQITEVSFFLMNGLGCTYDQVLHKEMGSSF